MTPEIEMFMTKLRGTQVVVEIPEMTDKCPYHNISRAEKKRMLDRDNKIDYIITYEKQGCLDCDGYDKSCDTYFSPLEQYLGGLEGKLK